MYTLGNEIDRYELDSKVGTIVDVPESADLDTMVDFAEQHRRAIEHALRGRLFVLLAFSKVPSKKSEDALKTEDWYPFRDRKKFDVTSNWHTHLRTAVFKPHQESLAIPTGIATDNAIYRAKDALNIPSYNFETPEELIEYNGVIEMFRSDSVDAPGCAIFLPEMVHHSKLMLPQTYEGTGGMAVGKIW